MKAVGSVRAPRVILPVLLVSRILGCAPISISRTDTFRMSRPWLIYSAGLLIIVVVSQLRVIHVFQEYRSLAEAGALYDLMLFVVLTLYGVKTLGMHASTLLVSLRGELRDLINAWEIVNERQGERLTFFKSRNTLYCLQVGGIVALYSCTAVLCWDYAFSSGRGSGHELMAFFIFFLNTSVEFASMGQLFILSLLVWAQFKSLNRRLALLLSSWSTPVPTPRPPLAESAERFRQIHLELIAVQRQLNSCFARQVLFLLLHLFVQTVVVGFKCLSAILTAQTDLIGMHTVGIAVVYFLVFYAVMTASSVVKREANNTPVYVHQLLNIPKISPESTQQLWTFSLQLTHCTPTFDVCGLFPLDYSLLHGIVAAITTYLVILLQFQVSSQNIALDLKAHFTRPRSQTNITTH